MIGSAGELEEASRQVHGVVAECVVVEIDDEGVDGGAARKPSQA